MHCLDNNIVPFPQDLLHGYTSVQGLHPPSILKLASQKNKFLFLQFFEEHFHSLVNFLKLNSLLLQLKKTTFTCKKKQTYVPEAFS